MALPPAPTLQDIDIAIPILVGLSLVMSAIRFWDRAYRRRFGIDDVFCALSVLNMISVMVFFYMSLQPPSSLDPRVGYIMYYLAAVSFDGVVWMARISLAFITIRIAAFQHQKRLFTAMAGFFLFIYFFLVCQIFWICEREPGWKTEVPPTCDEGLQRTVTELVTDVISDLCLLVAPLYLLSKTSIERSVRIRLYILFSTCLVLTVVSVVQDVLVFVASGTREVFTSMVENAVALMVCNVPVVGGTLITHFGRRPGTEYNSASGLSRSGRTFGSGKAHASDTGAIEIAVRRDLDFETEAYPMKRADKRDIEWADVVSLDTSIAETSTKPEGLSREPL